MHGFLILANLLKLDNLRLAINLKQFNYNLIRKNILRHVLAIFFVNSYIFGDEKKYITV